MGGVACTAHSRRTLGAPSSLSHYHTVALYTFAGILHMHARIWRYVMRKLMFIAYIRNEEIAARAHIVGPIMDMCCVCVCVRVACA